MQRAAVAQRHADHAALGLVGRLADRLRHLAGLAGAVADTAALVADDDEAAKAKRRPPFTTFATRLIADELVDSSLSSSRSRGRSRSRGERPEPPGERAII
jgi:hypothetical protein